MHNKYYGRPGTCLDGITGMGDYYIVTKIDRKDGEPVFAKEFESLMDAREYIKIITNKLYGYSLSKVEEHVLEYEA